MNSREFALNALLESDDIYIKKAQEGEIKVVDAAFLVAEVAANYLLADRHDINIATRVRARHNLEESVKIYLERIRNV